MPKKEYTREQILNRIDDPPLCNWVGISRSRYECDEYEWNPFSGVCLRHDQEYGTYDPTEVDREEQDPDEWRDLQWSVEFACDMEME
jgi:hypothetical protein